MTVVGQVASAQHDAERAVGLVDRPVRLDAQMFLRYARAIAEAGRAVVAGARVDLRQSIAHRLVPRRYSAAVEYAPCVASLSRCSTSGCGAQALRRIAHAHKDTEAGGVVTVGQLVVLVEQVLDPAAQRPRVGHAPAGGQVHEHVRSSVTGSGKPKSLRSPAASMSAPSSKRPNSPERRQRVVLLGAPQQLVAGLPVLGILPCRFGVHAPALARIVVARLDAARACFIDVAVLAEERIERDRRRTRSGRRRRSGMRRPQRVHDRPAR